MRDRHVCAYCGGHFGEGELTVEHILPVSRGGRHEWTNVVTACRSCNTRKGSRRPEEANMPLLYVPYAVCRSEGFILSNRRILADQMAFLQASLPRHSRWAYAWRSRPTSRRAASARRPRALSNSRQPAGRVVPSSPSSPAFNVRVT